MLGPTWQSSTSSLPSGWKCSSRHATCIRDDTATPKRSCSTKLKCKEIVFYKAFGFHGTNHKDRQVIVVSSEDAVNVPWSNTSQHQRTFLSRTARFWNIPWQTQESKLSTHSKWNWGLTTVGFSMTLSGKMSSGREFREGHLCIQEEAEGIMGRNTQLKQGGIGCVGGV